MSKNISLIISTFVIAALVIAGLWIAYVVYVIVSAAIQTLLNIL